MVLFATRSQRPPMTTRRPCPPAPGPLEGYATQSGGGHRPKQLGLILQDRQVAQTAPTIGQHDRQIRSTAAFGWRWRRSPAARASPACSSAPAGRPAPAAAPPRYGRPPRRRRRGGRFSAAVDTPCRQGAGGLPCPRSRAIEACGPGDRGLGGWMSWGQSLAPSASGRSRARQRLHQPGAPAPLGWPHQHPRYAPGRNLARPAW
jgi:hypothetical protein